MNMVIEAPPRTEILASISISEAASNLIETALRSVVLVYRGGGNGAGVIWHEDGHIVTCNHVVSPEGRAEVVLADGRKFVGIVAARHPTRDLAIVKIAAEGLPALDAADSDAVWPGQLVWSLGHPLGMRDMATMGIISHRASQDERQADRDEVRADIWIRPGSSGGPLLDASGSVVGIAARVAGDIGYSVPSNAVKQFFSDYQGTVSQTLSGLSGLRIAVSDNQVGFLVSGVDRGSHAERVGLLIGDTILVVGTRPVSTASDVANAMRGPFEPGASIQIRRGGQPMELAAVP